MKVRLYSLLLILLSVMTICGCKSVNLGNPPMQETTTADELSSLKNYRVENSKGLYNLTDFINTDDSHKFCSYAIYDSDNILLIYGDFSDTADSFYYFERFNIKTLEREKLDFTIPISEEDTLYFSYYLDVLSVSPLAVYDNVNYVLYCPDEALTYEIPEDIAGGRMHYYDNSYYYYINDTLYKLTEENGPEIIWTLPKCYSGSCYMLSPAENLFVIEAYPIDNDEPNVYIAINLDTGSTISNLVTGPDEDFYPNTAADGRLCTILYDWDTEPPCNSIKIADIENKTVHTIALPDFLNEMTIETDEHDYTEVQYIYLSEMPLYDDYCVFAMQNVDGYLAELYLYDINEYASKVYDVFEITPYTEPVITYDQLDSRAEQIDETYDITVIFGDDALTEYSNYTSTTETNEYVIDYSMDILEEALALYPDGFFEEMQEEFCGDIVFYLAGPLYTSTPDTSIGEAGAVTYEADGMQIVAFNTNQLSTGNIVHELTHIVDNYLIYNDILWEYEWSELNPDDFYYYYSYVDENGEEYTYSDDYSYTYMSSDSTEEDFYFFDTYAKTFPTEDRARLMEHLLVESTSYTDFYSSPNVLRKMNYYFSLIRQGFDSSAWDDETAWENCLAETVNN